MSGRERRTNRRTRAASQEDSFDIAGVPCLFDFAFVARIRFVSTSSVAQNQALLNAVDIRIYEFMRMLQISGCMRRLPDRCRGASWCRDRCDGGRRVMPRTSPSARCVWWWTAVRCRREGASGECRQRPRRAPAAACRVVRRRIASRCSRCNSRTRGAVVGVAVGRASA